MNIIHSVAGDKKKDTGIQFSVHIYPPKNPSNPYNCTDNQGNPYDYYNVIDTKHWYSDDFTRTIRLGLTIVTKKMQKTNPYFKEVVDYINTHYPLSQ
jgi:hypothetical protein